MARPRKDAGMAAQTRIENAFWQMLAEAPISEITIAGISRRANVNHNTFYRYFASIDDLARAMLEATLVPEMPAQVLAGFSSGAFSPSSALATNDMQERLYRVCLLAGSHSPTWLVAELKEAVTALWLASAHIDRSALSDGERAQLAFIVGGVISVIGACGQDGDLSALASVAEGELGRAIVATIAEMAR